MSRDSKTRKKLDQIIDKARKAASKAEKAAKRAELVQHQKKFFSVPQCLSGDNIFSERPIKCIFPPAS